MTTKEDAEFLVKSTSVLERVLTNEKIKKIISFFPELTNALNDNLDLAQRLTKDSSVPALLGPKLWQKVMSFAYSHNGVSENEVEILNVLTQTLQVEGIWEIVKEFPECKDALSANQNLATAIVCDGTTSQMMDIDLWKELISIMKKARPEKVREKASDSKSSENTLSGTVVKSVEALMCEVQQLRGDMSHLMEVVDCMFRDTIHVDLAIELLPVASQCQMKNLSRKLVTILGDSLLLQNCVRIFKASIKAELDDLRKLAQDAISYNFKLVSEKALDFGELTFGELSVFVFSKTLTANEEDVFDAICKWVKADEETRRCHVPMLFQGVRYTCCNLDTLKRIKDHYLMMDQHEVHSVIESLIQLEINSPGELGTFSQEDRRSGPAKVDWYRWCPPEDVLFVIGGQEKEMDERVVETYNYKHNCWIQHHNIPNSPRGSNVCVAMGHCIFVLEHKQKRVLSFNTMTRFWHLLSPLPVFRESLCLAQAERHVYAMGGKVGYDHVDICHAYNAKTNTWTEVSRMNERRNYGAATSLNGLIYCCGGYDGMKNHSSVEVFDPARNTWTFVCPMTEPRQAHCLVTCGDFLWAIGGIGYMESVNALERYNPVTDVWTTMSPMPTPRFDFSAAVLKGRIYTIGGEKAFADPSDNMEIYDPATDRWSKGASICKPRSDLSACVVRSIANAQSYTG